MGDMAKSILPQFFLFFSVNPSISKTVRGTGLKFCTQVGSDDPMCSDVFADSEVCVLSLLIFRGKGLQIAQAEKSKYDR